MQTDTNPHHERRWLILAVLGLAQLMVVLDATIVNIALPSAQADLGFSDEQPAVDHHRLRARLRQPAAARRPDQRPVRPQARAASSACSASPSRRRSAAPPRASRCWSPPAPCRAPSRALLAPAALSLLTTTFTDEAERNKAFGVYGAIAGTGGGIGLLLGGVLTEYLSWRWSMYVNLFFAVPAALGALSLLRNQVAEAGARLDLPGALTATTGLFALVYGFTQRRDRRLGRADHDRDVRRRGGAAVAVRLAAEPRRSSRCCRCASSSTATAAAPTWRWASPASACSASSCSSPTTCRRASASPRSRPGSASCR